MNTPIYAQLQTLQKQLAKTNLRTLFTEDEQRFEHFFKQAPLLSADFSKNHITPKVLESLVDLAKAADLGNKIKGLTSGEIMNITEQRAAFHTALRLPKSERQALLSPEISTAIDQVHTQMQALCNKIHSQTPLYSDGEAITDVVNLGIGGSDLGPAMVYQALSHYHKPNLKVHFVSNVDGNQLHLTLKDLNPNKTLFIIASKSFTTQETFANAKSARAWLEQSGLNAEQINHHFMCITSKPEKAAEFGILSDHILPMWDWVGGRYSLWSAIGLPIALGIGFNQFEALLQGAHQIDDHFQNTALKDNLPVLLALVSLWYINFWQTQSHAILPYEQLLSLLTNHLQQVDMESNGKQVQVTGEAVTGPTAPVIWGQPGTNGQHAYHQMLFQGKQLMPMDFIVGLKTDSPYTEQHDMLVANCLAQSRALMWGLTEAEAQQQLLEQGVSEAEAKRLAPHKAIPGNQPSTTIVYEKLTPETLGALIALYEHKVFVQGVLWNINSFDQYGVELGKVIGQQVLSAFDQDSQAKYDDSTDGLIGLYRNK